MELTVRSSSFTKELGMHQGVVDRKATIPILDNVLLEAVDGKVNMTSTNLEISVLSSCPATVSATGAVTIPLRRLHDYVQLLPDAELKMELTENYALILNCASARTSVSGSDKKNYPEMADFPEETVGVSPGILTDAIQKTMHSVADEQSRYTMTGALMVLSSDLLSMISTDGHRLSMFNQPTNPRGLTEKIRILIPRKAMAELLKMIQEPETTESSGGEKVEALVEIANDKKHMFFRYGGRQLIARHLAGEFPEYMRVLPKDLDIELSLENSVLSAILRRVAQFSDRSRTVELDLSDNKLTIRANATDIGQSEESIPVDYTGSGMKIGFNSSYMLDFLRVCSAPSVLLRLKDPKAAAQFEVPSGNSDFEYRYVIMPIRI